MKRLLLAGLLLLTPILSAREIVRFTNGRWFDGTKFVQRTMISAGGVFVASEDREAKEVDLRGAFVLPPFADAHHHAFADGRDPAETIARFLRQGVFYVKNPNNLPRLAAPIRGRVNVPTSVDVVYSNGGFTSKGGHPAQIYAHAASQLGMRPEEMAGQAYYEIDGEADLERVWLDFLSTGPDFVKIYIEGARGLDPKLVPPLVRRAHAAKLTVSAHIASAADFRVAVAAGVDEITHLPLERLTEADAQEAAKRGTRVVTTTISHRPTAGIADLDAIHRHNLKLLHSAGVPLAIGTDNDPTAVAEAENLHRLGAFDSVTLLNVWTRDTAQAVFPSRKIGRLQPGYEASFIALQANPLDDFGAIRRITSRVKQGQVLEIAAPLPLATEALAPIAMTDGAAAAIRAYDRMRAEKTTAYDTGEQALNQLGYMLLRHGKVDDAVEVFRANADRFPHSANTWDSLAEAHMTRGDRELAIRNYEKSLQLNPHNKNAAEMLKKLR